MAEPGARAGTATMDFFGAQEQARKRSRLLLGLYLAAVLVIAVLVFVVVRFAVPPEPGEPFFDPLVMVVVLGGVSAVIGGGSLSRTAQLRKGGSYVASMLGGRRIDPATTDPDERRLVNVVEEMALASGTPVPAIFVLENEAGLNAFAAGHDINDAAVAVTRGMLRHLSRGELQGVIAHEFSHILNGDMRLNIRLIGILHGLLFLAIIGRGVLRGGALSGGRRSRGGRGGGGGAAIGIGLALVVLGYLGIFFGKLIKAAISREREYLADAAAVQFTRNPDGLGGALKKIGGHVEHGRIRNESAEEASHLFFASGFKRSFGGALATHPPLEKRIRRVDPSWNGEYVVLTEAAGDAAAARRRETAERGSRSQATLGDLPFPFPSRSEGTGAGAAMAPLLMASIGQTSARHLEHAGATLQKIPAPLREAAHDPARAEAVVFALLLDPGGGEVTQRQLDLVERFGGAECAAAARGLMEHARELERRARLPLLDITLPALRGQTADRAAGFRRTAHQLIRADGKVRMFDYALVHILARQLPGEKRKRGGGVHSFKPVREEVQAVLSAVAWAGRSAAEQAQRAFDAGAVRLPLAAGSPELAGREAADVTRIDSALTRIGDASMGVRRRFLDACAHIVAADGAVSVEEAEVMRAIAESLDCPMPPLLQDARAPAASADASRDRTA